MSAKMKLYAGLGILLALACFARGGIYAYATAGKETVKIIDCISKFPPKSEAQDQKYLVFTDKGEFENSDSGWRFKWNSSHLQNECTQLKSKQVIIYYYGWRNYYLSWYPNIYRFELPQDSDAR